MAPARYIQFQTQGTFTDESFGAFGANSHEIDPVGEDITGDQQYIYPRTASIRNIRGRITGNKRWSGPLNTPLYPTHAASLIYYALGTATTVSNSPGTGVNTHTIVKANTVPFFRAGIGRDLNEHRYVGGIISSLTFDYAPDEVLLGTFETVLRRELTLGTLDTSVNFPDYDVAERAFGGPEVQPKFDDTNVTFVESASITYENSVDDDAYALGNAHLPAGIVSVLNSTGSMDLRYDATDRYTDWLNGTNRKVDLLAEYGSGTSLRRINIQAPVISYDVNRLPTDNSERYVQTIDFTLTPDSNSDPLIVTVVNAQSNAQFTG